MENDKDWNSKFDAKLGQCAQVEQGTVSRPHNRSQTIQDSFHSSQDLYWKNKIWYSCLIEHNTFPGPRLFCQSFIWQIGVAYLIYQGSTFLTKKKNISKSMITIWKSPPQLHSKSFHLETIFAPMTGMLLAHSSKHSLTRPASLYRVWTDLLRPIHHFLSEVCIFRHFELPSMALSDIWLKLYSKSMF